MPDWTTLEGARIKTEGADAANSRGTGVTASATLNTKGAYTQLTASLSQDADGLVLNVLQAGSTNCSYLLDLAIGTAGSEQIIVPDLLASTGSGGGGVVMGGSVYLPIPTRAGQRLAARCQASTASAVLRVLAHTVKYGLGNAAELGRIVSIGTAAATSRGTSIDPGASAGAKGAWTQLTASSPIPARGVIVMLGNQNNSARTNCTWLVDIGIGAAGSETVLMPDMLFAGSAGADTIGPCYWPLTAVAIPAGTRIAARASCSITDATDRLFDIALLLVG